MGPMPIQQMEAVGSYLAAHHPLFGSSTLFLPAESGDILMGNFREAVSLFIFALFIWGPTVLECSVGDV